MNSRQDRPVMIECCVSCMCIDLKYIYLLHKRKREKFSYKLLAAVMHRSTLCAVWIKCMWQFLPLCACVWLYTIWQINYTKHKISLANTIALYCVDTIWIVNADIRINKSTRGMRECVCMSNKTHKISIYFFTVHVTRTHKCVWDVKIFSSQKGLLILWVSIQG